MALQHRLKVLAQEDMDRVHEASLKILTETGVVFHHTEALEIFKQNGAKVEGEVVYFSKEMVESALEKCPSTFKWSARNEENSVIVGDGFLVQPNVGPVYISDKDNGRRFAKLEDYANIQKLCQASDVINTVGAIPIDPSDVKAKDKHLYIMYEILKNTDKPVHGYLCGGVGSKQQLDMVEIAFGQKGILDEKHLVGVSVNPLSPLSWAGDTLETIIEYAKRNQIIFFAPCIMRGTTGPVSSLGTAVLQNTEILSGIVLTQLIKPGCPCVHSDMSQLAYLKTAAFNGGSPEAMFANIACLQMGLEYYKIPTRTLCGITESKLVDCQAGYETMQNVMMGVLGGAHILCNTVGVLESIMTISYEKFIIDEELLSRAIRIWNGIDISDKALSVDIIQEVGHMGTYLTHQDTFDQYRDQWQPRISDWGSYEEWTQAGAQDVVTRANKKFKEILQNAPESLLDPVVDKELKDYISKAIEE